MQWIFVSLSYNVLVLCMYYVLYPVSCILYPVVNELANWHNTCLPNMQLCKSPIITHSFVHSFISLIHYKGATQKRSKPQRGRLTQIWVSEWIVENEFWEVIGEPMGNYSKLKDRVPDGGADKMQLKETSTERMDRLPTVHAASSQLSNPIATRN